MDACRDKAHAFHMGYMHVLFIMIITGENICNIRYSRAYSEIVTIICRAVAHLVVVVLWIVKRHSRHLSNVSSKHLQSINLLLAIQTHCIMHTSQPRR